VLAPSQILSYIKAQPFRPFRVQMASGNGFDIKHPEIIKVGKNFAIVFTYAPGQDVLVDEWETVSLMLAESVSHLDSATAHGNN